MSKVKDFFSGKKVDHEKIKKSLGYDEETYKTHRRLRTKLLLHVITDLIDSLKLESKYQYDTYLDKLVLLNIVERYFIDIARLKLTQEIEVVDESKCAGYLAYWVAKLKPLTVITQSQTLKHPPIQKAAMYANELLALDILMGKGVKKGSQIIMGPHFYSILHTLRYRQTSGNNLRLIYQSEFGQKTVTSSEAIEVKKGS